MEKPSQEGPEERPLQADEEPQEEEDGVCAQCGEPGVEGDDVCPNCGADL